MIWWNQRAKISITIIKFKKHFLTIRYLLDRFNDVIVCCTADTQETYHDFSLENSVLFGTIMIFFHKT